MLDIVNCLSVLDIAVLFVMQSMTIRLKSAIEHKFYARIQMKFLCMFCREITVTSLAVRLHFISVLCCNVQKLGSVMTHLKNFKILIYSYHLPSKTYLYFS